MRHPHGLRAAAAGLPSIGAAYEGGFFAGAISHTANGVATHLLIVAPAATGATGTGYTLTTNKQWKTTNTTTAGTTSTYDGAANSANMNNASHPAAEFCETLSIGGYTDWYLPARDELEIAYYNFKPTTVSNNTSWGINAYSVPARGSNYTSGDPARTTITAFLYGNSEYFVDNAHTSSTENSANNTRYFSVNFNTGEQVSDFKAEHPIFGSTARRTRAFRRVAL